MYSSEDLERFYFQYQTEAVPRGESVESFCLRNKVPYNIFSKWYKDTRKQIVEVRVEGRPTEDLPQLAPAETDSARPDTKPKTQTLTPIRILVELRMSNGLHITQKNLSYQELLRLVEKLEALC